MQEDDPGADVHVHVVDDVEFEGDPGRIRQLLENLYANSVEHGSTNPRSHAHEDHVEHGSIDSRDATRLDNTVEHGSTSSRSHARNNSVEHGTSHGGSGAQSGVTITVGALPQRVGVRSRRRRDGDSSGYRRRNLRARVLVANGRYRVRTRHREGDRGCPRLDDHAWRLRERNQSRSCVLKMLPAHGVPILPVVRSRLPTEPR